MIRYFIIATDREQFNTTVYYTPNGWTALRKYATGYTLSQANDRLAKLAQFSDRFADMALVAA